MRADYTQGSMTVMIIGGSGFLGRAITDKLLSGGYDVVCADTDVSDAPDHRAVTSVEVDVTDRDRLSDIVSENSPEAIVHLAYIGASADRYPSKAARVNCVGVDNVLSVATDHDIGRVVYASSAALYGTGATYSEPVTEDANTPAAYTQYPSMLYSAMKQLNEYQSRLYADTRGLDVAAVRPAYIFGPGYGEGYTRWASDLVAEPLEGSSTTIPFPPDEPLPLVYKDDAVRLFLMLLETNDLRHHSYNTGCYSITPRELAAAVEKEVGGTVNCDENAPAAPFIDDMSSQRAAEEFGYSITSLDEAIQKNVESLRDY
jgi:nucleoside-diphosphate-sugar epimerase